MRRTMAMLGMTIAVAAVPAAAQSGQYDVALRRIITEVAANRCPEDVMATPLLTACRQQLPTMGPGLAGLGAIESITFVKAEDRAGKRLETWAVKHAGGKTMVWGIGDRQDGRFAAAFTLG